MNDDKKQLMKIRLRKDGTWEHVYSDGSVDQEFYQMDAGALANLYTMARENKLREYAKLDEMKTDFIEQALELSNCSEAKAVINYIKSKK
jgi:hypothetical protein